MNTNFVIKKYFDKSVYLFKPKKFIDKRGFFSEVYNYEYFKNIINIKEKFVQDNYSFSKSIGTIRGLHLQKNPYSQAKLIRVLNGKIQDVIVDVRKKSKTYGKTYSFTLSKKNEFQLYIPSGFAHGFCTLEKNTEVLYKASKYYYPKSETTILWSDKDLKIKWKVDLKKVIVNEKDSKGINFNQYKNYKK
tara:strand:+ start:173 stop:742 length:570 start_codon:yes stop_codon:yes gene_type:complete